jgi:hypothetical protein
MAAEPQDRLDGLRVELEGIDRVEIAARVELFERANTTIARELSDLDEV